MAFWAQANLTFLITLLAGIVTSIALLARLITWLLDTHPVPVWAFFSGLILASIFLVLKPLQQRGGAQVMAFLAGTAVAVAIGLAPPCRQWGAAPRCFSSVACWLSVP